MSNLLWRATSPMLSTFAAAVALSAIATAILITLVMMFSGTTQPEFPNAQGWASGLPLSVDTSAGQALMTMTRLLHTLKADIRTRASVRQSQVIWQAAAAGNPKKQNRLPSAASERNGPSSLQIRIADNTTFVIKGPALAVFTPSAASIRKTPKPAPAGGSHRLIGCEPAFSPLSIWNDRNFHARCLV